MYFPKVLIFGQPFNNKHGGGITLSNLFRGWDKDKIAVAATGHVMKNVTTDVCDTYYQLGIKEYKWRFPFNLIQKKFPSGLKSFASNLDSESANNKSEFRYAFVNKVFYPILEWFGLYHNAAGLRISDSFKKWLKEYKPELLYLQVSSFDTVLFARELKDYLGIPSVIHMMDDWPSTISKRGPFRRFWYKKIDSALRSLFNKTDLFLSISEAMSDEYHKRYNKNYPIDAGVWQNHTKKNYKLSAQNSKILYSGRIGPGITNSLIEIAQAIDKINSDGLSLKFHIQSPTASPEVIKRLLDHKCTVINPVADYADLPEIYSSADILVIANDFDEKAICFLRYSMPTKASEYMISGTPILVYSHHDSAVSKFFINNKCGCCVTEQDGGQLLSALKVLINDENYRATLGSNAVRIASDLFDGKKKREEFRQLMVDTAHYNE